MEIVRGGDPAAANLFFDGNNTTFDAVEGGLVSGMAIANDVFGAPYAIPPGTLTPVAFAMFAYLSLDVMFPQDDATTATAVGELRKAAFGGLTRGRGGGSDRRDRRGAGRRPARAPSEPVAWSRCVFTRAGASRLRTGRMRRDVVDGGGEWC